MARFQTRVSRKVRFVTGKVDPEIMKGLGEGLVESIQRRMSAALNVYDTPAAPLKPSYAKFKQRKYGTAVRDLFATGRTRRSMKVLSASPGRAVIGFTDAIANMRVAINNRRERQFGVSPDDRRGLMDPVRKIAVVKVTSA